MSKYLYIVFKGRSDGPLLLPSHIAIFYGDPEFNTLVKSFLWEQGIRLGKWEVVEN